MTIEKFIKILNKIKNSVDNPYRPRHIIAEDITKIIIKIEKEQKQ